MLVQWLTKEKLQFNPTMEILYKWYFSAIANYKIKNNWTKIILFLFIILFLLWRVTLKIYFQINSP